MSTSISNHQAPAILPQPQSRGIIKAIGGTSLIQLTRVVPVGCARIFAKLEWENPTGSMKDRMALAVIEGAERRGLLKPGYTVIEYTGGSTGTSLAFICAVKGYKIKIVTSEAFSQEKRDQMEAFGAELVLVKSENGLTSKKLILDMIDKAKELSQELNTFWVNQLHNADTIEGYKALGEEIWQQTKGKVDWFVHSAGTAASSRGTALALKKRNPNIKLAVVEPGESAVLSGGSANPHKIEGVGIGYTPPLYDKALVSRLLAVPTAAAKAMTRRLAREEGIFAGTSSGANVLAAIELGMELGPSATIVTLMCDSGLKYLSTDVYRKQNRSAAKL